MKLFCYRRIPKIVL